MITVPFFKPSITNKEIKAVIKQLKSGWLTFGEKTEQFEEEFAKYIDAPHVVMTDNCTAALFLACEYFKQSRKIRDIVVDVPSLTCAATALAPIHAGMKIKFIDIEEGNSFIIDESFIGMEDAYEVSIPVHFAGLYSKGKNTIIEDSAHRIVKKGFYGNTQAYSFYVTKNITTSEGGAIACKSKEEADWYKKARLYGNSKAIYERSKMYSTGEKFWWFESEFCGWKANPTDMLAVLGLVQLKRLDEFNAERAKIADRYNNAFGLTTNRYPWHLYPILVKERDKFMYYMKDKGITCSVHFPPLHMMKAFKKEKRTSMKETERVYNSIVSLPLFPYMTVKEQDYVIKAVLEWGK